MTKSVSFDLRIERIYYCHLKMFFESKKNFNVKLRFIDKNSDHSAKEIYFTTEDI